MAFDSAWIALVMMAVLAISACRREVTRAEWIVFFVFAINLVLIQYQLGNGLNICSQYVDWRYLMPGWGLVILLTVGLLVRMFQRTRRRPLRIMVIVTVLAIVIRPAYKSIKRYCKYHAEMMAIEDAESWAADYIKRDWRGPSRGAWEYYPMEYHTDRLPRIVEHFGGVARSVGGRPALVCAETGRTEDIVAVEIPDYVLIRKGYQQALVEWFLERGGIMVSEREFRGFPFLLLRRERGSDGIE